jgi:hypothetical protein
MQPPWETPTLPSPHPSPKGPKSSRTHVHPVCAFFSGQAQVLPADTPKPSWLSAKEEPDGPGRPGDHRVVSA